MSNNTVFRHCSECGARVKAAPKVFESPQKCPKCGKVVRFLDYPRDEAKLPVEQDPDDQKGWFDYCVYTCFLVAVLTALLGLGSVLVGAHSVTLLAGAVSLVCSTVLAVYFAQLHVRIRRISDELKAISENYKTRSDALVDAVEKNKGFKLNFEQLVREEYDRLHEEVKCERHESMQRLAWAESRGEVVDALGKRFLAENVKWISSKLTPNNFTASRQRLEKVIAFCRKSDYEIAPEYEVQLFAELKAEYERVLRADHAKQEQARIKAQIRDEKKAERELEREMQRVEAERRAIENALEQALRETEDQHSAEIELLRAKLLEAEEKARRTQAMAELTKAGHIYVISNMGSFGENVYKIGMTRRLEPMDRVKELGDASVPFPFDVHAMISCDNAPGLESTLHKALHHRRVNKVNLRKEFFRVSLEEIRVLVEQHHGEVEFEADVEALEYLESRDMSSEDYEYISSQMEAIGATSSDDDD